MSTAQPVREGETFDGPSKTLTDAHFLFFSGLSGDVHPIRYDVEYAKATRYGRSLARGVLLVSMTARGASAARERMEGLVFVERGSRFLRPAVVGDTIRPRFVFERSWQEGKRRFFRFATRLLDQRDEMLLEGFHVYQPAGRRTAKEAR
jgi:acyl dehydratase